MRDALEARRYALPQGPASGGARAGPVVDTTLDDYIGTVTSVSERGLSSLIAQYFRLITSNQRNLQFTRRRGEIFEKSLEILCGSGR